MTIAAGLVCSGGLVIFADTEEQQGLTKTRAEKIRQYSQDGVQMAIASAGNGFLADALIDRIFDNIAGKKAHQATLVGVIRQTIIDFHRDEVALYPSPDDSKSVGLIIGMEIDQNEPILLHADASALRKVSEFAIIGYGAEIKFLAQQFYRKNIQLKHGVLIANYLCKTAKEYVQGCGGHSRIATIANGKIEIRHFLDIFEDEQAFFSLDTNYRAVLLSIPDEEITDEQFHNCLEWLVEEAWEARDEALSSKRLTREVKQKMTETKTVLGIERYYSPVSNDRFGSDRRGKFLNSKRTQEPTK
jgi:20S proteasome alpha/beta subunit